MAAVVVIHTAAAVMIRCSDDCSSSCDQYAYAMRAVYNRVSRRIVAYVIFSR